MTAPERGLEMCFFHDRVEPVTSTTYRVCFECHHVFPTQQDFEDSYREEFPLQNVPVNYYVCPLCAHDL